MLNICAHMWNGILIHTAAYVLNERWHIPWHSNPIHLRTEWKMTHSMALKSDTLTYSMKDDTFHGTQIQYTYVLNERWHIPWHSNPIHLRTEWKMTRSMALKSNTLTYSMKDDTFHGTQIQYTYVLNERWHIPWHSNPIHIFTNYFIKMHFSNTSPFTPVSPQQTPCFWFTNHILNVFLIYCMWYMVLHFAGLIQIWQKQHNCEVPH